MKVVDCSEHKDRQNYFDLIRVFSTFLIVSSHFSFCFVQYSISGYNNFFLYTANTDAGKVGVYLFFMLSGGGLAYNYARKKFDIISYYKKRWLKIFPLFYLCYIIFLIIKIALKQIQMSDIVPYRFIWTILGMDSYLSGEVSTYAIVGEWFTGAIIILYLLFPVFLLLYRKSKGTYLFTTIIIYSLYLITWYVHPLPHPANVESIFSDLLYFWIGMMMVRETEKIDKIDNILLIALIVPLLLVHNSWDALTSSLVGAILIWIIARRVPTNVYKSNKLFQIVSRYSYVIYLIHHQIIYLILKPFSNSYLNIGKSVVLYMFVWAVIIMTAALVYKIYELLGALLKNCCKSCRIH